MFSLYYRNNVCDSSIPPASVHADMTTVFRYSYSTLQPLFLALGFEQPLVPDQIMHRNCMILALYIGATSRVDLGEVPYRNTLGRAQKHIAAFVSRTKSNSITINSPG